MAQTKLPDLVIAAGATVSNIIERRQILDARSIGLIGGTTIDGGKTYTIEVTADLEPDNTNGVWATLTRIGYAADAVADETPPATGKARTIKYQESDLTAFTAFRIKASGGVASGGSTWHVTKNSRSEF